MCCADYQINIEEINMKKSKNKLYLLPCISGLLFIIFTVLVKVVDVQPIGPMGTSVGFAGINSAFHAMTGENVLWYKITQFTGVLAIATAGCMALAGVIQLIQKKNIFAVDEEILFRGIIYAIVIILYILFEKLVINYRPVIMAGDILPQASYPSTHTMLICCVMGVTLIAIKNVMNSGLVKTIINVILICCIIVTVIGRLICGVHWLTDIIGGVIISICLVSLYNALINNIKLR